MHSHPSNSRYIFIVFLTLCLTALPTSAARAADPDQSTDSVLAPGWERIGGFRGGAGSSMMDRLNDLLFEEEASGDLYRDLSDVTIGVGLGGDHLHAGWDNAFYRRVLPLHREIEPGGIVTGRDLSSYIDVKTLVSRGRLNADFITDIVNEKGVVGMEGEGGVSLTLGRVHAPLRLGDMPMDEALASEKRDLPDITRPYPEDQDKSLVRLSTEGIAALSKWIATAIGEKTIDTERAQIFYDSYDQTATLFIDVGLPIDSQLFTEEDDRLGPGDFVRQVTFAGLYPVSARIREYGAEISYRYFYRVVRETSIVKEPGGTVLVRVRTGLARGQETIPLKIRPELRIFGILRIGYTMFQQLYTNSEGASFDALYRIDLTNPRGMECFKSILGEGRKVQWKPLQEAAVAREGAEQLRTEIRDGDSRSNQRKIRGFSLYSRRNIRLASQVNVDNGFDKWRETDFVSDWRYRKTLGRDRNEVKTFLARSIRKLPTEGTNAGSRDDVEVQLITGVRNQRATGSQVRRGAWQLRRLLDWNEHPVLEQLESIDPNQQTRYVLNLRLVLGGASMEKAFSASDDAAWSVLADFLLGSDHRDAWKSPEARDRWKKSLRAGAAVVDSDAINFSHREFSPRARYRLAERMVKRFNKLREITKHDECVECLTKSLDKWEYISLMQALLVRLGNGPGDAEVGYHYEVFVDEMLRPRTVTNIVRSGMPYMVEIGEEMKSAVFGRQSESSEDRTQYMITRTSDRQRDVSYLKASASRLQRGDLVLNTGVSPRDDEAPPPCLVLRIYSDTRFAGDISLRIDLREFHGVKSDVPLGFRRFGLGEPTAIVATPFLTSRYSYDISLPMITELQEGETYTLLLRALNEEGLTVSEEQKVKFKWPKGAHERAIRGCTSPDRER